MRRSRVEDVLDVLREIRKHFARVGGHRAVEDLRTHGIDIVARQELGKGRFRNHESATKSIHDACTRRLTKIQHVGELDYAVHEWLAGTSERLRAAVTYEVRSDRELSLVKHFFGVPSLDP
jgi:hypothetical protein